MKSIEKFLSTLNDLDIRIWIEAGRLRINAPKGTLTPALQTELSERKTEILEFLQQMDRTSHSEQPSIQPIVRDGRLPLSFAQQRLWFLNQLDPDSAVYNMPAAFRLIGHLNVTALMKSLNEIVSRHETLRTTFSPVNGEPIQIIAPEFNLNVPTIDLSHLPKDMWEMEARRLAAEEAQRPFDLVQDPMLRVILIRRSHVDHILLLTMHHIASDGWSIGVFRHELEVLYETYVKGQPSPLPDLPIQYADFAAWQREWLQGDALYRQLAYWKKQLEDVPVLHFPTDRPRPATRTFQGARHTFLLPSSLSEALEELSRREGLTLFMLLLAAFQTLLYRYTDQEDLTVGSPIANRNRAEIEGLIGFFVNILVLRTKLAGSLTFRELLAQVRRITLEAYDYQDLPFEKLVEEIQPDRDMTQSPLFQVAFVFQNAPVPPLELSGLEITQESFDSLAVRYDLELHIWQSSEGLSAQIVYNTDLFEAATIVRMAGHFQTLLASIVADPDQQLSNLSILPEAEQHQVLIEWNDTSTDYPRNQCIHELFEVQVEQTPDAVAVVFENRQLTYRELNQRANQLAHYLRSLGVGPEILVGICLERSLDLIVSVLGILKAGGAYVPFDPTYPQQRLTFMLNDSQVNVLLTHQHLLPDIHRWTSDQQQIICLDTDGEFIRQQSADNPPCGMSPDNLAYIIYTSGSTGTPKGVMIAHRGLCNLAQAQIRLFQIHSDSRVLQFASLNFDASISEIVITLCAGATLCLAPKADLFPGPDFLRTLKFHAVTHVTLPPSALSVMPATALPTLKVLIVAGEAFPADLADEWSQVCTVINAYGPTESTVCTSGMVYEAKSLTPTVPIGRPIENIQVYILDRWKQPVPIGVPGELYIGGIGLARGYLNRPDLTQERFLPHPFDSTPGSRLYKTGDLARYLPDGIIEFLGRIDHQVKLRGFRIELGEIEALLRQTPYVHEAVALVREDAPNKKQLTAYVVPNRIELWPSVAEYFVYDDLLYYAMTHDERRNQSYKNAFQQLVKGKTVVEIGTGPEAILSRFCVDAGAAMVYGIELNEKIYHQALARVQELQLEHKIMMIHGDATSVDLPELADVCISEIVGPIGGCEGAAVILNHARKFLKSDGVMVPIRSDTKVAAISLPDDVLQDPAFTSLSAPYAQEIFDQVGYPFDVRVCLKGIKYSHLISDTKTYELLDFSGPVPAEFSHPVTLTIQRDATLDGFLIWLTLQTIAGESIDILAHEHCWLPVYFPVFSPGIEVSAGDTIEAVCSGTLCENYVNPDYHIQGQVYRQYGEPISFHYDSWHHREVFQQTSFYRELFAQGQIATTPTSDPKEFARSLSAFLRENLPEYMVPSAFVMLDTLPLTPSCKVDRKALPVPFQKHPGPREAFEAPRNQIEILISEIWKELLGIEQVSVYDNFFDVGGHSLLVMQVISRIEKELDVQLRPGDFMLQTLGQIAAICEEKQSLSRPASPETFPQKLWKIFKNTISS